MLFNIDYWLNWLTIQNGALTARQMTINQMTNDQNDFKPMLSLFSSPTRTLVIIAWYVYATP